MQIVGIRRTWKLFHLCAEIALQHVLKSNQLHKYTGKWLVAPLKYEFRISMPHVTQGEDQLLKGVFMYT